MFLVVVAVVVIFVLIIGGYLNRYGRKEDRMDGATHISGRTLFVCDGQPDIEGRMSDWDLTQGGLKWEITRAGSRSYNPGDTIPWERVDFLSATHLPRGRKIAIFVRHYRLDGTIAAVALTASEAMAVKWFATAGAYLPPDKMTLELERDHE